MPKFQYYIVNVIDCDIKGTNETAVADEWRGNEDAFVIDTIKNQWLLEGEETSTIADVKEAEQEGPQD